MADALRIWFNSYTFQQMDGRMKHFYLHLDVLFALQFLLMLTFLPDGKADKKSGSEQTYFS